MNWWVGPATRPRNLGAALEAHGFRRATTEAAMSADLHALDETPVWPAGLTVERLSDPADLPAWYDVLAACFGYPDPAREPFIESTGLALRNAPGALHCYLGRLAGEPVATSFMVLGGGVAGLHGVGTLPRARRQGIGAAMTLAPLRDARALGYRVAVLRASALGIGVYRRLSFRSCGEIAIYTWWPPDQGER